MNKLFTTIILITGILAAVFLGISAFHSNTAGDIIKNNITGLLGDSDSTDSDSEADDNDLFKNLVHSLANEAVKAVGNQLDKVKEISRLLLIYKLSFIIPGILSVLAAAVSVLPLQCWKYLISYGLSLFGCLFLLITDLLYIPWRIRSAIPDIISEYISDVSITFGDLVRIIIHSSGITVFPGIIFLLITAALSLTVFFISGDRTSSRQTR